MKTVFICLILSCSVVFSQTDCNTRTGDYTGEWTAEWTSPDSGEVQYYCGFPGHYAGGMVGYFVVEGGSSAPGFGLFSGIVALFIFSLAIPTLRRN